MAPKSIVLVLLLTLALFINESEMLKILGLFRYPAISHFYFFQPIMRGLADAGHDVTVISQFPDKDAPANYKDLLLPEMKVLTNAFNVQSLADRRTIYQSIVEFYGRHKRGMDVCENALNSTVLRNILKTNERFDVILMEQYNDDCMMGVAWKLNAPVIGMSSCVMMPWHFDRVASPLIPSFMPGLFLGYSDQMPFSARVINWIGINVLNLWYTHVTLKNNDDITRKYLQDENMPHLREPVHNTNMMFVNSHYSFGGSRPFAPTIVELGGIHIKEAKPLDPEIKAILDSAKDGVIYVSWGSMIRAETLPVDKRNSLLKAFGSFEQTFLWKWENDTLPDQPKNVHIRKWMQQREILCHPNVRAFVSHGGAMGSNEASFCGVPMVLTPMYLDQFHNSAAASARGMGWIVHYEDITEETMKKAISNAMSETSQNNAKKVSYSYRNRQKTPVESAVWWVEYIAATGGGPLLKSYSSQLSIIEYYSLDVIAMIVAILLLAISPIIFIIFLCLKKLKPHKNVNKSKTE